MVRSFVGGLELIVSLLKSNDREVFSYITPLTLDTLTSVCIFSILFPIHFPRSWQGEFILQSISSLTGDHFLYSRDFNV